MWYNICLIRKYTIFQSVKLSIIKITLVSIGILFGSSLLKSQSGILPNVFMIGEYENSYEQLFVSCEDRLLSVCDNSMEMAYQKWSVMLSDLEEYSNDVNFDLRGIKVWVNVFWNSDGTIQNIVYYPKPNSRNMDFADLTSFFNGFVANYQIDLSSETCFSHYGSASFPTFNKSVVADER